jgi:hypothetical protein
MKILSRILACMVVVSAAPATSRGDSGTPIAATSESAPKSWYPTLGIGVPHPFAVSVIKSFSPEWAASLGVGFFYLPFGADRSAAYGSLQGQVRWHPFWDAFWVGAEAGVQSVGLRNFFPATLGGANLGATSVVTLTNVYVCPAIGAEWKYQNGWRLGLAFGWQLPIVMAGSVSGTEDPSFESASQRSLSAIAGTPLPFFGLSVGREL